MAGTDVKLDYSVAERLLECIDNDINNPVAEIVERFKENHGILQIKGTISEAIQQYLDSLYVAIKLHNTALRELAVVAKENAQKVVEETAAISEDAERTAAQLREESNQLLSRYLGITNDDVHINQF